jgi:hypothetical protein|tara:strand:- start:534 stop:932 length:399 start_codon:yes stop_codon:yes gene_type:complete
MAEMQKITKDEALAKVAQGVGSIYSKEDVVNLIESITVIPTASITEELKFRIADAIADEFSYDNANLIEDFEVDINQNYGNGSTFEVELTDIGLKHYEVREIVSEVLDANLDALEEEEELEEDEEKITGTEI